MDARRALALVMLAVCSSACDSDDDDDTKQRDASADSSDAASESDAQGADVDASDMSASSKPDYAAPQNWLCRPGHNDACGVNLDSTIVRADGTMELERFEASTDPKVDCFYVYPTVSLDSTPNSDLVPGPEEKNVVRAQFARFGSECRLFAPMYRQVTLTALRASLSGMASNADRTLGYGDVLSAWRHYLEHDNDGRGVVLVGHSQGSSVLLQLLKEQLDKESVDSRLITAMIIGANTLVPKGELVGGSLQHIPVCTADDELGCVVTYASFRSDAPSSSMTMFASSSDPALVAACTNPAALGGGSAELHAYLSAEGPGTSSTPMQDWVDGKTITTPFVSVPGMLSAECKFGSTGSFLSVTVNADASDGRTDDIVGDVVTNGEVQPSWGLHLIDVHLAMGNLLDLVRAKSEAYLAR
jgi:hypothetical protein